MVKQGMITALVCVLIFCAGLLNAAGSKIGRDVPKDAAGFSVQTEQGLTRVEFWAADTVRIIHAPTGQLPPADSLAVVAEPEKTDWTFKETKQQATLITDAVQVTVDKQTGRVSLARTDGTTLLAETEDGTTMKPAHVGIAETLAVTQQFVLDPDEAIYGLGQHQHGVLNYSGHSVRLQQENRELAVPVILSSKGYMLLWDNPAVTDVSFGGGRQEVIGAEHLVDEKGRPGGLTGTYYKGRNFESPVVTQQDSQIDFDWGQTPPEQMPHDDYSIRWTGFIEAPLTGEYTLVPATDDGVRLWIDKKQVVDEWRSQPVTSFPIKMHFDAGSRHPIRMEYYQGNGGAAARLAWQLPGEPVTTWASEAGHAVDYYVMVGANADTAVAAYRKLTGRVPMFAKWTWGFWQCKERYKTQDELLGILAEYRRREIPIDGIIQDWQYWRAGQWGSHEFDPKRYPDPAEMVKTIHELHAHTIISVWPRFDLETKNLAELEAAGAIYPPVYTNVYPPGKGKWYDPFSAKGRTIYWKQLNGNLANLGFDGWWTDACEAELGGQWGQMRELMTGAGPGAEVYNAYPLMHTTGVYQGQRRDVPEKRVFILARSAWAGQQRNGVVTWSGDIDGNWKVFANQIPAGLNFCATGIPYWNTDIGGFFGGNPSDAEYQELFTRWFQFGAFCPMFRVHGTGAGKEMWRFDKATQDILLDYDRLRYHLLPYIYSVSWQVTKNNYTMMRPLVMDFTDDRKVYDIADQYMFGPAIMVCPVIEAGAETRSVYLPAGTRWYDFWTCTSYDGGQTIETKATIDMMPLFVRAGSIIPYGPGVQYVDQKPATPIELRLYAGADGTFTLYEDEGDNYNYEKGDYATIAIDWDDDTHTLRIGDRKGTFGGMIQERTFRLVQVAAGVGIGIELSETTDAEVCYTGKRLEQSLPVK